MRFLSGSILSRCRYLISENYYSVYHIRPVISTHYFLRRIDIIFLLCHTDTSGDSLESREKIMNRLLWYTGLSKEDQERVDERAHLFFAAWEN